MYTYRSDNENFAMAQSTPKALIFREHILIQFEKWLQKNDSWGCFFLMFCLIWWEVLTGLWKWIPNLAINLSAYECMYSYSTGNMT